MAKNIEIKAHVLNVSLLEQRLFDLVKNIEPIILNQKDIYYKVNYGRLKLRSVNNKQNELIFYLRPNQINSKKSKYFRIKIISPYIANTLIKLFVGLKGVVKKERKLFLYENIRIHLDTVEDLGDFIEFEYLIDSSHTEEMGHERLSRLLDQINIDKKTLCSTSYIDMLMSNKLTVLIPG